MVERLAAGGYVGRQAPPRYPDDDEDSFAISGELPEDFTEAARAFLSFARERPDLLR